MTRDTRYCISSLHVVMNVLRLDKSIFGGISAKRKEITWDDEKLV